MIDINIKNKMYQDISIIENLNLKVDTSQFLSILGPSGCGKTTLLNLISNLDKEYDGLVSFEKDNSNIGFMFQDDRLIPWLSVFDNIMLVSKNKDVDDVVELLIDVGLEGYIDAYPKELSGGMKRRVAIVRAFINRPKFLLLDEPFISLDYPTAQSLRSDFLKFYKKYLPTVVFVTHDLKEAISLSNRIVFLDKKPMKIVLDYENDVDFSLNLESKEIDKIKDEILSTYPEILSGKVEL